MRCPKDLLEKFEVCDIFRIFDLDYVSARKQLFPFYMFKLDKYYEEKDIGSRVGSESFNFASELLLNAYCHGNGTKNGVDLGLFLSLDYFVLGCCDGGDYFKDLDIKRKWERKCHIKTMGMKFDSFGKFICGKNVGTNVIYSCTDKIFIDNEFGIFYGRLNPKKYVL